MDTMSDSSLLENPYLDNQQLKDYLSSTINSLDKEASSRESQALLIRAEGGVGKTFFLRETYRQHKQGQGKIEGVVCLEPIDLDDIKHRPLTHIQDQIIQNIKKDFPRLESKAFQSYEEYISNFTKQLNFAESVESIEPEAVVAYLRRGITKFKDSYGEFLKDNTIIPVVIFDTVEAIRSFQLQKDLVSWMKRLPGTFFILAGRPAPKGQKDTLIELLKPIELYEARSLPYKTVYLSGFSVKFSEQYLKSKTSSLDDKHIGAIVELSECKPLILALTLNYLRTKGMPSVVKSWLSQSNEYPKVLWQKEFTHQLLAPYFDDNSFWNQVVLRLAILRRWFSKDMWVSLVNDLELPSNVKDFDEAWAHFLDFPWVRKRAGDNKYITIHDSLSEILAKSLPLYDPEPEAKFRMKLWKKAEGIYERAIKKLRANYEEQERYFQSQKLKLSSTNFWQDVNFVIRGKIHRQYIFPLKEKNPQQKILNSAVEIDDLATELILLQVTCLHYKLLVDPKEGYEYFFDDLFDETINKKRRYDLGEPIWATMQYFLPDHTASNSVLRSIEETRIKIFQDDYQENIQLQFDIKLRESRLLSVVRPKDANDLLTKLLKDKEITSNVSWYYDLLMLRGAARRRSKGNLHLAKDDFEKALALTQGEGIADGVDQLQGFALSELVNYYLDLGVWSKATELLDEVKRFYEEFDYKNKKLKDERVSLKKTVEEFECSEITTFTQSGYIEALKGENMNRAFKDAKEGVIQRKKRLKDEQTGDAKSRLAIARTVLGEVYRLAKHYEDAYNEFSKAMDIVQELHHNDLLGEVYHQLAYCLFKDRKEGKTINSFQTPENLIELSIEYCCDSINPNQRPMALLRAGQIFFEQNKQLGLKYLQDAINSIKESTNEKEKDDVDDIRTLALIFVTHEEFVILKALSGSDDQPDLKYIQRIEQLIEKSEFIDLKARWYLLQGHLNVLSTSFKDDNWIDRVFEQYQKGFDLLQKGVVGSFNTEKNSIPDGYEFFVAVMEKLAQQQSSSFEILKQKLQKHWGDRGTKESEKLLDLLQDKLGRSNFSLVSSNDESSYQAEFASG